MKKINKIIMVLLLCITVVNYSQDIYSQDIPQSMKQGIVQVLTDTTSWTTRASALIQIINYKVTEAENTLKAQIWLDSLFLQPRYLMALNSINSESTLEYTNKYLHKIDSIIATEGKYIQYLRDRVDAISVLYSLGVYTRAEQIFELVEEEKPQVHYTALKLMKELILHVPEYEERAKSELIRIIENYDFAWYRMEAMRDLEEVYGADAFPQMEYMFVNDEDGANRLTVLTELLLKYKTPELNKLLRQQLVNEEKWTYRIDIAEILLDLFGNPNNLKYVKDYVSSENNETARVLIQSEVKNFKARIDTSSAISISTMLDTLTSYTNQCYGYDWLRDEAYKNELLDKIETAKNYLSSADSVNCAIEMKKFQNSVAEVYADSSGSYPKYVSNDGYKFLYYYAGYILDILPSPFPQNNIYAKVRARVVKKNNGNLKYKYKLKNKPESTQDIALFYVKEQSDTLAFHSPSGWVRGEIPESNMFYFKSDSAGAEIKPGEKQKGFSVKAKRLPYVANYYIQSERVVADTNDIYTNSATGYTLSPVLVASPFVALDFMDTLINYNNRAYELGWIKTENAYNNFIKKLNRAKSRLEEGKERKAKRILRNFVRTVRKKWRKRKITSEALALLKFNAQYLIKHIGPPDLEENPAAVTLEKVKRLDGEERKFKYIVHNSLNNTEKIKAFYVKESVPAYTTKTPDNWSVASIDTLDLVGFTADNQNAMINPDKKKKGYEIKVEALPVVMPYYLLEEGQPEVSDTILYGSISGFTLGAESLPAEFNGLEQTDNLYELVEEANDVGWIKNENVYENLKDRVETIRKKIEKGKTAKAKDKLQDFVDYVQNKYDEEKLTKEARILLRQNANYIKRNL